MDAKSIMDKLVSCEPLFDSPPRVDALRTMGTESEYGVTLLPSNTPDIRGPLPQVLWNGGELYLDCNHLEYASPETSNAVSAVAWYEAGKDLCWKGMFSPTLYCHNNCWQNDGNTEVTFGAHENYFTRAPRNQWYRLVPLLIARTLLCGAGWVRSDGRYVISQRASHITGALGVNTTSNRTVVNMRENEPLGKVKGWDRLHLIVGDANMSEVSTFLRLGLGSLFVQMLEMGVLPEIIYDLSIAKDDIRTMSESISDWEATSTMMNSWYLRGARGKLRGGLEILDACLTQAERIFANRDAPTDALLAIGRDTLKRLATKPMDLWPRLDWVAKLMILNEFRKKESDVVAEHPWMLCSQDMEYHNLDPNHGLYFAFKESGQMERIVSDKFITHTTNEPPADTRAYVRGRTARFLAFRQDGHYVHAGNWDRLTVVPSDTPRTRTYNERSAHIFDKGMPDPSVVYWRLLRKARQRMLRK